MPKKQTSFIGNRIEVYHRDSHSSMYSSDLTKLTKAAPKKSGNHDTPKKNKWREYVVG